MTIGSLWRRGGLTQVISILLFLTGLALGWWARDDQRRTLDRVTRLDGLKDRVGTDVMQVSDALQAWLLDPKNDLARKSGRDAQKDLADAIDALQAQFPDRSELVTTVKNLYALHSRILEQAEADATEAAAAYRRNYAAVRDQRATLLNQLYRQTGTVGTAEWAAARRRTFVALLGTVLILAVLAASLWRQRVAMAKPLAGLTAALERLRHGDFTQRAAVDGSGQFSELGDGLNRLADDLANLVGQVQRSGHEVDATATRIAATTREQQTTASEIAVTTAEIGTASQGISATSRDLVKAIDEISHVAQETAQVANSGHSGIERMEATLRQITEAAGATTGKLAVLSEKTANINSVVTTITKVADQTNLLSLNAAIEAEKAGEYGLGFAVVAMEIRRLADQTAVATYDIEKAVKEMQSAVTAGVMGMETFSGELRNGVDEIRRVGTQLGQVIQQVQTLTSRFQAVNEGMHAQASGTQHISQTLAELSESARRTVESLRQSNLAVEQLNEAAQSLQASLARFQPGK